MIAGKTIMFDCGMHLGYHDERRFPDFSLIPKRGDFTQSIDCIIITHFHLDHIGALPYFTEVCGYEGPIFMTYPTKALAPLMLEDYRKVMVERRGQQEQFSVLQIHESMKKVTAVDLRQTISLGSDIQLRAYYAGHVLGAAMFYVKVGESTVVYTGDYNMTPDRHLGAAQIDRLQPDLIITESTYATTIRDSKHARERDFLKAVHKCVAGGGKVLIPVFALGRAQELCILLDDYWERMNLTAPIYFSAGLTMQANVYYKLLIAWTNQKVKDTCVTRNTFDFKHVSVFDRSQLNASGPCVLFATPGMLNGGLSLEVFKLWAPFEQNMVVLPGYCVPGTVGYKLIKGKSSRIDIDKRTHLEVRCQVHMLSFSAHTDAKGIMDLLRHVGAKHVILVHGEKPKMALLKTRIISELGVPCFDPGNGETVEVPSRLLVKILASEKFLTNARQPILGYTEATSKVGDANVSDKILKGVSVPAVSGTQLGILMMDQHKTIQVLHSQEALDVLNVSQHKVLYRCYCPVYITAGDGGKGTAVVGEPALSLAEEGEISEELEKPSKKHCTDMEDTLGSKQQIEPIANTVKDIASMAKVAEDPHDTLHLKEEEGIALSSESGNVLQAVYTHLIRGIGSGFVRKQDSCIVANSLCIRVSPENCKKAEVGEAAPFILDCVWSAQDENLARQVMALLSTTQLSPLTTI
ncbi:hypothetical protein GOP47_0007338 [Adiantum capillus-veneris]|uniref:Cleavage and polyadenylation specificity factor subunit 3-II n=1 Tax=Adiantum capillus-veneris TaxID=13818 RepID=A0A9D4ZJ78_ADICA|nr:hypothetical protein GOP47_0007338 [Adiantum capillus-veneris]